MMIDISSIGQLSDPDLLAQVQGAAARERDATGQLVALLMELDARRLYLAEGCASLFVYCTHVLHLSEHAAYHRIEAARATRKFPAILERLVDGTVNLTAIGLLAPHLTPENHLELLHAARHKSKRDIEQLVVQMRPRPDAPTVVRKLPVPTPPAPSRPDLIRSGSVGGPDKARLPLMEDGRTLATCDMKTPSPGAPSIPVPASRRAEVKPLAPERYKIQFTVDRETHDKLRRAQDLLRHTIPDGDPAAIFGKALTLLLREISKAKHAAPSDRGRPIRGPHRRKPRGTFLPPCDGPCGNATPGSAPLSAAWAGAGRRPSSSSHHLVPYADGGEATTANLALRCRSHNAYEAEQWYSAGRTPLLPDEQEPERSNVGPATRSGPSSG